MSDSDPTVYKEQLEWYLYCIFIRILVEDRRPDLTEEEARRQLSYKYKTTITVHLFKWQLFYFYQHSLSPGDFNFK